MPSDPAPSAEAFRRLHPLSILFGIGRAARVYVLPGLALLIAARPGRLDTWLMVLAIPSALSSLLSWLRYRFRLASDEIVIRTGLISRRERHIPYSRVQDLRMVQGPMQRLLGVAELRIETGGGEEAEAAMRVLSTGVIAEIRRRHARVAAARDGLPRRTAASPTVGDSAAEPGRDVAPSPPGDAPRGEDATLVRLSGTDVVLAGLTRGRGWLAVAAGAGLAWEGGGLLGASDMLDLDWSRLLRSGLAGWFRSPAQAWWLVVVILAAFASLRLLSVLWALLSLHGFTLTRRAGEIVVSSGLLTHRTSTIPLHRVQAVSVSDTWLQRLAGLVSVRASTAGGNKEDASEGSGHWIAPSLAREDLPALVRTILPGADLGALTFLPVHPGARRRLLREWLVILAGVAILGSALLGLQGLLIPAILLPIGLTDGRKGASALGYAVGERAVVFRKGWWVRRLLAVTPEKIQTLKMTRSPFDRRHGMASLAIDTAGGGEGAGMSLPYLPESTAGALVEVLTRRAARSRFKW